jgi:hypothetical protein
MKKLLTAAVVAVVVGLGFAQTASAGQWGRVLAYCQTPVGYGPVTAIHASRIGSGCRIFIRHYGVSYGVWYVR